MLGPAGTAKLGLATDDEVRTKSVIVADNVTKHYGPDGQERTIIRDFTLRIQRGDRIGVVGANGAFSFWLSGGRMVARDRKIARVILLELLPPVGAVEQHEGCEVRQFDSFVKDKRCFHATVGEENAAAVLRLADLGSRGVHRGHGLTAGHLAKDRDFRAFTGAVGRRRTAPAKRRGGHRVVARAQALEAHHRRRGVAGERDPKRLRFDPRRCRSG